MRLPGILSDIDGVVYRGGHEIGNSRKVIQRLLNNTVNGVKVPFALLTNGGGIPEDERAEHINEVINLHAEKNMRNLQAEDLIVCHTPFR